MSTLALPVLLALSGCSTSADLRPQFAQEIESADVMIQSGELVAAGEAVATLLQELESLEDPRTAPQRMICDALLVEIHAAAMPNNGFLTQPGAFEFDPMSASSTNEVISTTAHRLAAVFHGWHLTARGQGSKGWVAQDGDVLVVPEHASRFLDPEYASRYVALIYASSLAELGFHVQAEAALRQFGHPEYGTVFDAAARGSATLDANERPEDDVLAILDEYELPDHLRWQILATAHDIYRRRFEKSKRTTNPTMAFRFGCLAALGELREERGFKVHRGTGLHPEWREGFYAWVEDLAKSNGDFRSQQDVIRQGITESTDSGDPAIRFVWTPKSMSLGGTR